MYTHSTFMYVCMCMCLVLLSVAVLTSPSYQLMIQLVREHMKPLYLHLIQTIVKVVIRNAVVVVLILEQ